MKHLLSAMLFILSIAVVVIIYKFIQYRITVNSTPGNLNISARPGLTGRWVDPFIGTGGFPSYTSGDDIPGVTMPFGMVRLKTLGYSRGWSAALRNE